MDWTGKQVDEMIKYNGNKTELREETGPAKALLKKASIRYGIFSAVFICLAVTYFIILSRGIMHGLDRATEKIVMFPYSVFLIGTQIGLVRFINSLSCYRHIRKVEKGMPGRSGT